METPYSLSDRPGKWDDIQLMRSKRGANACHVQMGLGEYIDVAKQNLPQFFFFLFEQEGPDICLLIQPA